MTAPPPGVDDRNTIRGTPVRPRAARAARDLERRISTGAVAPCAPIRLSARDLEPACTMAPDRAGRVRCRHARRGAGRRSAPRAGPPAARHEYARRHAAGSRVALAASTSRAPGRPAERTPASVESSSPRRPRRAPAGASRTRTRAPGGAVCRAHARGRVPPWRHGRSCRRLAANAATMRRASSPPRCCVRAARQPGEAAHRDAMLNRAGGAASRIAPRPGRRHARQYREAERVQRGLARRARRSNRSARRDEIAGAAARSPPPAPRRRLDPSRPRDLDPRQAGAANR